MPITVAVHPPGLLVVFSGVLTFHEADDGEALLRDLEARLAGGGITTIRFDLSRTEAMDSHWLGVFVRLLRRTKEKGVDLVMQRPTAAVRRLFEVIELDRIVTIED